MYIASPPYYLDKNTIKLPAPSKAEAIEFLNAALRHCARSIMKWELRYEDGKEGDPLARCANALYEQTRLSQVWNPVLTQAVRAVPNFSPTYISGIIGDIVKDARPANGNRPSSYPNPNGATASYSDNPSEVSMRMWSDIGKAFGDKIRPGVEARLKARPVGDTVSKSIALLVRDGKVAPSVIGMLTPDDVAEFSPSIANGMRRKGMKVIAMQELAKALDREIQKSPGPAGLYSLLLMLDPIEQEVAKSESTEKAHPAVAGWARRMRKEKHPFSTCVAKMRGKVDNAEAFCARAHIAAYGVTPSERKKHKAKSISNPPTRLSLESRSFEQDFVHRNFPSV